MVQQATYHFGIIASVFVGAATSPADLSSLKAGFWCPGAILILPEQQTHLHQWAVDSTWTWWHPNWGAARWENLYRFMLATRCLETSTITTPLYFILYVHAHSCKPEVILQGVSSLNVHGISRSQILFGAWLLSLLILLIFACWDKKTPSLWWFCQLSLHSADDLHSQEDQHMLT